MRPIEVRPLDQIAQGAKRPALPFGDQGFDLFGAEAAHVARFAGPVLAGHRIGPSTHAAQEIANAPDGPVPQTAATFSDALAVVRHSLWCHVDPSLSPKRADSEKLCPNYWNASQKRCVTPDDDCPMDKVQINRDALTGFAQFDENYR